MINGDMFSLASDACEAEIAIIIRGNAALRKCNQFIPAAEEFPVLNISHSQRY
jgi:hypothetical protein